jgi:hypothetical protein
VCFLAALYVNTNLASETMATRPKRERKFFEDARLTVVEHGGAVRVRLRSRLHIGQAAKHGDRQTPDAGACVGPRLGKRTKLCLGVHDLFDDGEQVEGAAREAVDTGDDHNVAGGEVLEHFQALAPVRPRARHLLAVDLRAACVAQLLKLGVERLAAGADAGIGDAAVRKLATAVSK